MIFKLIDSDDWVGLYADGLLVAEGHDVSLAELAKEAGLKFSQEFASPKGQNYLHNHGNFPQTLEEWEAENGY